MEAVGLLEGSGVVVLEAEDTLNDKVQPNKKKDNEANKPYIRHT